MEKPRLLLLGWDAADWQIINPLLDAGEMPFLKSLIERGVMGDIRTLRPVLSPMLWNSIATGKRADQHGILGFTEVDEEHGRVTPSLSSSRKCKALWNITSQNDFRTNVVGWFAGHPAEPINGVCISEMVANNVPREPGADWPLPKGATHPAELEKHLDEWRLRPEELDSDVLGHFVPRISEVEQDKDPTLSTLARLLCEAFTTHAATVHVMEKHPWDFMAAYYINIDHFSHAFMQYHPPRMETVDEKKFELYNDIVRSCYRLHDLFLGRLLGIAGEECHVMLVSDHGFRSDHLRPKGVPRIPAGPATWHRDTGIFCFAGPGVRRDEIIHGATLLDVAPTILHALGLPVGKDMEGKPLVDCWSSPGEPVYIDSWEDVPGEDGTHNEKTATIAPSESEQLLEQFVALGYVEKPTEDNDANLERTRREQDWNLARVYLEKGRYDLALPLIEKVYEAVSAEFRLAATDAARTARAGIVDDPDLPDEPRKMEFPRPDIASQLTQCYLQLGYLEEARRVLAPLMESPNVSQSTLLLQGQLRLAEGEPGEALSCFEEARAELGPTADSVAHLLGRSYRKMRRWKKAEECFRRAIQWDPSDAPSRAVLAEILIHQRRYGEAVDEALDAIQCDFNLAKAHYFLGAALCFLPDHQDRTEEAFRVAIRLSPGHGQARRALYRLYRRQGRDDLATEQWEGIRELLKLRREKKLAMHEEAARRRQRLEQADAEEARALERYVRREFIIVSGLPRSGTSLMMSMLEAGGIPILTDSARMADEDNPEGYYEWEAVKKLSRRPRLIEQADEKAVKIVSPLLSALPAYHKYKVIFMMRPVEEIDASQALMRARRGEEDSDVDLTKRIELLERHRSNVLLTLLNQPRFDVLEVDFPELVADPAETIARLETFLHRNLDTAKMTARVRPDLHRNKRCPRGAGS